MFHHPQSVWEEDTVFWKSFLEASHSKQPGRSCCSRSCYLPLNGVRKPFCLLAEKQRDAETSSLFTALRCAVVVVCALRFRRCCLLLCRAYKCKGRTTNVTILGENKGPVFGGSVAVVGPRFAAPMSIFILGLFFLLIEEHTLVSHTHALTPEHKSHSRTHV